jgi:hypothetical protein
MPFRIFRTKFGTILPTPKLSEAALQAMFARAAAMTELGLKVAFFVVQRVALCNSKNHERFVLCI